jgi:hypothetical protein
MTGTLSDNQYIFKNVPLNEAVKIVAITFKGNQPLLGIARTTTTKKIFDQFQYKAFTIAELEKELNTP